MRLQVNTISLHPPVKMSDSEIDIETGRPKGAEGSELNESAGDKQVAISNSEDQNNDMETKRDGQTMSGCEFNVDTLVSKRERRKPHLGLKAQESRTYMLTSELTKSVSGIYRFLRSYQQGLVNDILLDTLYDMHDAIGDQMKSIRSLKPSTVNKRAQCPRTSQVNILLLQILHM